jgi:predicted nucleotidyltransferase component of viral defense system
MNSNFLEIIAAHSGDRRDLFLTTANRIGTTLQNVEKDFWVCWILDLLFNGRESHEPRLLFKGGTSLSKAYGLISRFSEDIDITIFPEDLGQSIAISDLEKLSANQQRRHLDNIKKTCQAYVQGKFKEKINHQIKSLFYKAGITSKEEPVILDENDSTAQSLLIRYPSVNSVQNDYVKPTVKIEAGAKSALDPHQLITLKPYVADDLPSTELFVKNIVTIEPERTFWDKVMILHGLRRWHDIRGQLRHEGNRVSRHYYDIYKLFSSESADKAKSNLQMAIDCAQHAQLFFNSKDLDLQSARPGSFKLAPSAEMIEALKRDYLAMSGMIFGEIPSFENVISATKQLEDEIKKP